MAAEAAARGADPPGSLLGELLGASTHGSQHPWVLTQPGEGVWHQHSARDQGQTSPGGAGWHPCAGGERPPQGLGTMGTLSLSLKVRPRSRCQLDMGPCCKSRAWACLSFPSLPEEPCTGGQCPRSSACRCWHRSQQPSVPAQWGPRGRGRGCRSPEPPPKMRWGAGRPRSTRVLLHPGGFLLEREVAGMGSRRAVNIPVGQEEAGNSGRMGRAGCRGGPRNPNQPLLPAQHRAGKGAGCWGGDMG